MAFKKFQDTQISLGTLQDEMNRLVERVWHAGVSTGPFDGQEWAPPIDLYEYPERYVMFVELPGVDVKDIDVSHVENALTIRGERHAPTGESGARSVRAERRFGGFCRTINLSEEIEPDSVSAKCHNGVLEVTIPKSKANMPKSVKIDVAGD